MDKLTPEQRHKCMARIRSKNTRPEMIVRRYLFANGYRYRIHVKSLPGTPDIVIPSLHTVILVNGCFWHGHEGCPNFVLPKSNVDFWHKKIERNRNRDHKERLQLRDLGWHVIVVWECQLMSKVRSENLRSLLHTLNTIYLQSKKIKIYDFDFAEEERLVAAEEEKDGYLED